MFRNTLKHLPASVTRPVARRNIARVTASRKSKVGSASKTETRSFEGKVGGSAPKLRQTAEIHLSDRIHCNAERRRR